MGTRGRLLVHTRTFKLDTTIHCVFIDFININDNVIVISCPGIQLMIIYSELYGQNDNNFVNVTLYIIIYIAMNFIIVIMKEYMYTLFLIDCNEWYFVKVVQ